MPSSDQVKQARDAAGLSVTAAAKLIGVARITWHRWESEADYKQPMSERDYRYFLHVTGQERLTFPQAKARGC